MGRQASKNPHLPSFTNVKSQMWVLRKYMQWSSHGNPDPWEISPWIRNRLRIQTKPISHVEFSPSRFLKLKQPLGALEDQTLPRTPVTTKIVTLYLNWLVVGFNPSEKYACQNGFIFPNFQGENKRYLKPPPSSVGRHTYQPSFK